MTPPRASCNSFTATKFRRPSGRTGSDGELPGRRHLHRQRTILAHALRPIWKLVGPQQSQSGPKVSPAARSGGRVERSRLLSHSDVNRSDYLLDLKPEVA